MKNKYAIGLINNFVFIEFMVFLIEAKFSFQKIINNIIYLGGENFRYNHFSLNSKGDMIIDTTAFPGNKERRFFGLKKNGRPYFYDENNFETPYRSLYASNLENINQQKVEGESSFIIISKRNDSIIEEYLMSFSKEDNYVELYDFENNLIIANKSSEYFGKNIVSNVCSFFKAESRKDDNYNYYIAYIYSDNNKFKFYVQRNYFTSKNLTINYHKDTGNSKTTINKTIASCFETKAKKIVCFYYNNYKYTILAINESFSNTTINYTQFLDAPSKYNLFFKAIHFKKEVGAFIYYANDDDKKPFLSIKYCKNEDNMFYNYNNFGSISIGKKEFNSDAMLNDIIKINDYKICFIAPSYNKESLIIVILFLYNNDKNMSIRYYSYEMFNECQLKFFNDLRAFLFNNFISLAFSHCPQRECENNEDQHFSSLIIFNYPNSTSDNSIDLIQYLHLNNNIDNFNFSLDANINYDIENNIFGYIYKEIKILNYPENTSLIYKINESKIERNSALVEGQIETLIFPSNETFEGQNYTIEYAYVLTDPDYSEVNNYTSRVDDSYYDSSEETFYKKFEYIGRSIYFNITISEDLFSSCDDMCSLCYRRDNNSCVICKYNYTFNGTEKICLPNPLSQTTLEMTDTILSQTSNPYSSLLSTEFSSSYSSYLKSSAINTELESLEKNSITSLSKSEIFSSLPTSIPISESSLITTTFPKSISSTILTNNQTSFLNIKSTVKSTLIYALNSSIPASTSSSSLESSYLISNFTSLISSTNIDENSNKILLSTLPENQSSSFKDKITYPSSTFIKKKFNTIISTLPTSSNKIIISNSINNEEIKCNNKEVIKNECSDSITNEQIDEIYEYIKENIIKNSSKYSNIIIKSKNVIFQVSSMEAQKLNKINLSSIDLGLCEQTLKNKENLTNDDDLIVFKIDIKSYDLSLTYVKYEIYNPKSYKLISLDSCKNSSIIIKSPVNLAQNFDIIYESLNSSGYNLLNLNDSFYSDICSTYTSKNGTDISMSGRKTFLYDKNSNVSFCQTGCYLYYYDYTNKKAICRCAIQNEETVKDASQTSFTREDLGDSFYKTIENSNFLVMKCYKLVFSIEGQLNNIGSYIIIFFIFLFILFFIWNCIKGNKTLDRYIIEFFKNKTNQSRIKYTDFDKKSLFNTKERKKNNKRETTNVKKKYSGNIKQNGNTSKKIVRTKKKKLTQMISNIKDKSLITFNIKKLQINKNKINAYINNGNKSENINKIKKSNFPPKKKIYFTNRSIKKSGTVKVATKIFFNPNNSSSQSLNKKSNDNLMLKQMNSLIDNSSKKNILKIKKKSKLKSIFLKDNIKDKNKENQLLLKNKFNDEELNSLEYENALIEDKRTYCQYYWSLIKKKQIILFTFISSNDYNLFPVKICLLLLSFSLFFTINGFFFTDETMNRIYEDNGYYDIIYQIPQILYSTLISSLFSTIFKRLSLSEKQLLSIKKEKNILKAKEMTYKTRKNLKIRIVLFHIIGLLFMVFFWYFISCFCAVYKNTQIILIKDTLLSFMISMVYPFGINLFPGMFRIPSLRSIKKDKKYLYNIGKILSFL